MYDSRGSAGGTGEENKVSSSSRGSLLANLGEDSLRAISILREGA